MPLLHSSRKTSQALAFDEIFAPTFADEDGIYWCADCSAMAAWILHPIAASHLMGGELYSRAKKLGGAIGRSMPENASMQFIFLPIHNIDNYVDAYLDYGVSGNRMLQQLAEAKAHFYRDAAGEAGFRLPNVSEARARRHVVMCTLTVYQGTEGRIRRRDAVRDALRTEHGLKPVGLLPAQRRLAKNLDSLRATVVKARTSLERSFRAVGMGCQRADAATMVQFCRTLIHPQSGPKEPVVLNPETSLGSQVCRRTVDVVEGGEFIYSDGMYTGTMTVDGWPQTLIPGIFSRESRAIDGSILDYLSNGVLSIGISRPSREEVATWLEKKGFVVNSQNDASQRQDVAEDLQLVKRWLNSGEHRMLDVQVTISLSAPKIGEVRRRELEMQATLAELGFSTRVEDACGHWMWARHLPGGFYGSLDGSLRISRRCDLHVAAILPVYGCGRGTRTPMHLATNERWEPFAFYQFDHRNAFNVVVAAESGAGKSVLISNLLMDFVRKDRTLAAIIDYGGSYGPSMSLLGDEARNVDVSPKKRVPMNIFAGTYRDCGPWLTDWIPMLVTRDDEQLDPLTISHMGAAIEIAYRRNLEKGVPYQEVEELFTKHRGKFIDWMRKRFYIETIEDEDLRQINDLKTGDARATPTFEVYRIVRIRSYQDPETHERRMIESPEDIDERPRDELQKRYRHVEHELAGIEESGVFVLVEDRTDLDTLVAKGYEAEIDDTLMVLECETIDDYETCVKAGLRPYYDEDYLADLEQRFGDEFRQRFPGHDHEAIAEMVDREIEGLDPLRYWNHVVGRADLQREVIFSDFILAAKDLNQPTLNDLVDRLRPWYGDGMYADYFDKKNQVDMHAHRLFNFDLKPMFSTSSKLVTAYLAALLQRIATHYDGIETASYRKMIIIDEFQRFTELGVFVKRFTNTVCRQARKNGYSVLVGTQKVNDLRDPSDQSHGKTGLLGLFQWYFLGTQEAPQELMDDTSLGFSARMAARAAAAGKVPGYWADFLLYSPAEGMCEIMRSIQSPFEYWLRTTDDSEIPMRTKRIHKYQNQGYSPQDATIEACKELAREFPRGYVAQRQVSIS